MLKNGNEKATIKKVEAFHGGVQMIKKRNQKPTNTKPELFSSQFEKRYNTYLEEMQHRKDERLKQV